MRRRAPSPMIRSLAGACVAAALAACSADELAPPEPTVETPGAFVAVEDESLGFVILRTKATSGQPTGERILIVDVLDASPESFEEARALARGPELPVRTPSYFITLRTVLTHPHEVLWFRSLEPGQ